VTTVAFDGNTIATDSQATADYIQSAKKLFKVNNAYIGVAGTYSYAMMFVRWYKDQTKEKPSSKLADDDFVALVIRQGKAYAYDNNCIEMPMTAPCAIGSGSNFAMGAMYMGATAKQAVECAKQYCPYTGGKVQTAKIK